MDRFVGMGVFVKVVEGSSFSAAARHFGLSPAMVSKHIQSLEDRLGARLLNRTTRKVTPTEIGREYYDRARRIIADMEEADRTASDMHATPRGVLKVNAPLTFGNLHVAPAISDFLAANPEVSVDLSLTDHYIDLLQEGLDVAIRIGHLPDSSLIAKRLAPIRMAVVASPRYLERHSVPATPADLADHNCLAYTYSTTRGEWRFTGPDGRQQVVEVSGRFSSNNGDALKTLALNGEGIIISPAFIVCDEVTSGRLVPLLPDYKLPEKAVQAVYPHSRYLSAKVRSFVDFLAARFETAPERIGLPDMSAMTRMHTEARHPQAVTAFPDRKSA